MNQLRRSGTILPFSRNASSQENDVGETGGTIDVGHVPTDEKVSLPERCQVGRIKGIIVDCPFTADRRIKKPQRAISAH